MPPLPLGQNKLKKAILILSFLLFSFCLFSQNEEYYFYKNGAVFLSPVEKSNKEIDKILKLLSSKKYKKAKAKLYNLKLEIKNKEDFRLIEKFILFLEKTENSGADLIKLLREDIPCHKQIKAEIYWLWEKRFESFDLYSEIYDFILDKPKVLKSIQRRVEEFSNLLDREIKETLEKGNFDDLCLNIQKFPEKLFKGEVFYKGKTLCSIIDRNLEEAERYIKGIGGEEKKKLIFFVEILKLGYTRQLEELKGGNYDEVYRKFANYLYFKVEDFWLLENMPPFYSIAYNSKNINLKEMATLFCLYFPQIRGEAGKELKEEYRNIDPLELSCIYPLILGRVIDEEHLEEKLEGENFISYLNKFLEFLNLLNPCGKEWEDFVECGIIPAEKSKEKIEGAFLASIIKKIKGDI